MSRHKPKSDFVTRDHLWIRIVGGPFESELEDDENDDDDKEKDEEDEIDVETQRKIVGHELRATEAIQNAMRRLQSSSDNKEHASVLNQVIVDYLGYRAIVTAIPITQFGDDIEDRTTLNMLASGTQRTTRDVWTRYRVSSMHRSKIRSSSIMSHHRIMWTRSMTR